MQDIEQELDMASNMIGKLDRSIRARVRSFYMDPTADKWDDVAGILLSPTMTAWQAWLAIDPTAPRGGRLTDTDGRVIEEWKRIPTRREFAASLEYATH